MPDVIVIAGPNGAGKSTAAPFLLQETFGIVEFVNADTIATEIANPERPDVALQAGRIMLRRINELAESGKDFAFETTLATRSYPKLLIALKRKGYNIHFVFLWLSSSELAIERVAARVREGGHDIPIETIRRRYCRGIENFFKIYRPLADSWQLLDASGEDPIEVAYGSGQTNDTIIDNNLWKQIEK